MKSAEVIKELESLGFKSTDFDKSELMSYHDGYDITFYVKNEFWVFKYRKEDCRVYYWDSRWVEITEDLDVASMIVLYGNK